MAVQAGRREQQDDCKNAFCQLYLPKGDIIIIHLPKGCPISKVEDLSVLHKIIYRLRRSQYHCYQSIKKILLSMGLSTSPRNLCVFTGSKLEM